MAEETRTLVEVNSRTINGREVLAVTSIQVAEHFGKEHFHVMRDIKNTVDKCSESFNASNFGLVEYTDAKGEKRPMYVLSKDGFMMVTMGYTTPEAMRIKEVYISRFNEMEQELVKKTASAPVVPMSLDDKMRAVGTILGYAGLMGNQKALAADKFFKHETGVSALGICGVVLVNPRQKQLLTPTELGKLLDGTSAKNINIQLALEGLQWRTPNGSWEPTEEGRAAGGTLLDTGKKHSDGTPVCQLKWPESVTDRLRKYLRDDC